ncbi:MAG: MFS transporter [Spirochaetaceae bacterium]|jgi:MFS family permease|nr:MFS transporter [Spirochaetaceae bacterium]
MILFSDIYREDARKGRFLFSLVVSGIAYGLYRGMQDNYLVEILHVTPFDRGIIEFFREIPGLLVVLFLAMMYQFAESKIFKIGLAIMLAGITGLFAAPALTFFVVLCMIIFSIGEHIIMPVKSTISLNLARPSKGGAALGVTSTINNLGNIAGYLLVTLIFFVCTKFGFSRDSQLPFKLVLALSSTLLLSALLIAAALKGTRLTTARRRFYFARKYQKYYMLEVFYGARKQIFFTFAPLVLIAEYGANTSLIAFLLALCAGAGMIFSPLVGRLIDRIGFKPVMICDTLILIAVCFFYGFSQHFFSHRTAFIIVCVNFIFDSILSLGSMATNVYVQSISSNKEEITATLSTGISVNHLISIFIALLGGWIWNCTGIEVLFSLSALLGLLNSIYAATIKTAPLKQRT